MDYRIKYIKPLEDCVLEAIFFNGDVKFFDLKKIMVTYYQYKVFKSNPALFQKCKLTNDGNTIYWADGLDLDSQSIWIDGEDSNSDNIIASPDLNIHEKIATLISDARHSRKLTQIQLSQKTNIIQADISRIEKGLGNPSIDTISRIADALGYNIKISFNKKNS